jgi:hypothetical protein
MDAKETSTPTLFTARKNRLGVCKIEIPFPLAGSADRSFSRIGLHRVYSIRRIERAKKQGSFRQDKVEECSKPAYKVNL